MEQKHCGEIRTNSVLTYWSNIMPRSQICGYWCLEKIQFQQFPFSFPSGRFTVKHSFLIAPCFPFSLFFTFPCSLHISLFLWLFGCLTSKLSRAGITGTFPEVMLRINNTLLMLFSQHCFTNIKCKGLEFFSRNSWEAHPFPNICYCLLFSVAPRQYTAFN